MNFIHSLDSVVLTKTHGSKVQREIYSDMQNQLFRKRDLKTFNRIDSVSSSPHIGYDMCKSVLENESDSHSICWPLDIHWQQCTSILVHASTTNQSSEFTSHDSWLSAQACTSFRHAPLPFTHIATRYYKIQKPYKTI